MPILTSILPVGVSGQVSDTAPTTIETYRYLTNSQPAIYTIDLNPISATIQDLNQYVIQIDGQNLTLTFRDGGGSKVQNLAAQLSTLITQYGYYWSVILSSGVIRLTARTSGVTQQVTLGSGLIGSTITLTQAPTILEPPKPGSLLWFIKGSNDQDQVTTYDVASAVPGFDADRDLAGVLVNSYLNYRVNDSTQFDVVEVLRSGHIWVRNYGTAKIDRTVAARFNPLPSTPTLPCGGLGLGTELSTIGLDHRFIAYSRSALPGEQVLLRVNLP